MGVTSFLVPQPERLLPSAVRQCFMQGIDAIPWQSQNELDGNLLTITRDTKESGQLYIPWPVPGHGLVTLSTTCLRETNEPYCLPIELARGTVGRLRNQVEAWQQHSVQIPAEVTRRVTLATRALGRAVTSAHESAAATQAAEEAMVESMDTIGLLMRAFSQGALAKSGKRNVFLGANWGNHAGSAFPNDLIGVVNTAVVPFSWNDVEGSTSNDSLEVFAEQIRWSKKLGLRVCGGPLLNFGEDQLPDWLYLWEEDAESLQSYMLGYVESIVRKFAGQVNIWHAWAGLNCGQAMNLSEEFRLRVGVAAVETLRQIDGNTPVFVSFDRPWGEYLSRQTLDLAPIHYADTLVRAQLGVSGFGLEINLGYWPNGTLPRDLLEISKLIDRWGTLGLPLVIILTIPSREQADEEGIPTTMPTGSDEINESNQARIGTEIVRLSLAKPVVQGVIWNQFADGGGPYPHGGLFTREGTAKPIVAHLKEIRQNYVL